MQIPILIEPVPGNGFRSRGGEPFALSAEGSSRDEVLRILQDQLQARLRAGAEVVILNASTPDIANPWREYSGMFQDDPYFEEWQQAIADNRRKIEQDPNIP